MAMSRCLGPSRPWASWPESCCRAAARSTTPTGLGLFETLLCKSSAGERKTGGRLARAPLRWCVSWKSWSPPMPPRRIGSPRARRPRRTRRQRACRGTGSCRGATAGPSGGRRCLRRRRPSPLPARATARGTLLLRSRRQRSKIPPAPCGTCCMARFSRRRVWSSMKSTPSLFPPSWIRTPASTSPRAATPSSSSTTRTRPAAFACSRMALASRADRCRRCRSRLSMGPWQRSRARSTTAAARPWRSWRLLAPTALPCG
mmetsp:Transcript_85812/g.241472  ORF Transcript_85812/g.241472 Transcript_85812/m.241472 type:complete len:259 (+) Transcript_85812:518-1294(+)